MRDNMSVRVCVILNWLLKQCLCEKRARKGIASTEELEILIRQKWRPSYSIIQNGKKESIKIV